MIYRFARAVSDEVRAKVSDVIFFIIIIQQLKASMCFGPRTTITQLMVTMVSILVLAAGALSLTSSGIQDGVVIRCGIFFSNALGYTLMYNTIGDVW